MKKYIASCVLLVLVFIFACPSFSQEGSLDISAELDVKKEVINAVDLYLNEKTKYSGTLDLYDDKVEDVRNLRKIKVQEDMSSTEGNLYTTAIDYRDIKTGDIVAVVFTVENSSGIFKVKNIEMVEVKGVNLLPGDDVEKTDYPDEEIQNVMKAYIASQSKFIGYFMLYDEESQQMRKLELKELQEDVKRMGIYYISKAIFKDIETEDVLDIDITVENIPTKGLQIQGLRIRGRSKMKGGV